MLATASKEAQPLGRHLSVPPSAVVELSLTKRDWCPVWLADGMIDTEFGSLTNITDCKLKSWSLGGRVAYAGHPVKLPRGWTFAVPENMRQGSLTFNWSNDAAAVAMEFKNVVAITGRTGALPVRYFPEGHAADKAIRATRWEGWRSFAGSGDVNLYSVAMYFQLYQIFQLTGLTTDAPKVEVPEATRRGIEELTKHTQSVLTRLALIGNEKLDLLANTDPDPFWERKS